MSTVFLSSPITGLKECREAAFNAVLGLGHQCIRMEDFSAVPEQADDYCRRKIGESDIVCFLIGPLYGSRNPRGISYTRSEYETAVACGKPCLVLMTDADFKIAGSTHQNDADAEDQRAFREELRESLIIKWFSNEEQVKLRVTQALAKWQADQTKKQSGGAAGDRSLHYRLSQNLKRYWRLIREFNHGRPRIKWLGSLILFLSATSWWSVTEYGWLWLPRAFHVFPHDYFSPPFHLPFLHMTPEPWEGPHQGSVDQWHVVAPAGAALYDFKARFEVKFTVSPSQRLDFYFRLRPLDTILASRLRMRSGYKVSIRRERWPGAKGSGTKVGIETFWCSSPKNCLPFEGKGAQSEDFPCDFDKTDEFLVAATVSASKLDFTVTGKASCFVFVEAQPPASFWPPYGTIAMEPSTGSVVLESAFISPLPR